MKKDNGKNGEGEFTQEEYLRSLYIRSQIELFEARKRFMKKHQIPDMSLAKPVPNIIISEQHLD